jgi:hypothetical protein
MPRAGFEVPDLPEELKVAGPLVRFAGRVRADLVRHLASAVAIDDDGVIAAEAVLESSTGDEQRAIAILVPVVAADAAGEAR